VVLEPGAHEGHVLEAIKGGGVDLAVDEDPGISRLGRSCRNGFLSLHIRVDGEIGVQHAGQDRMQQLIDGVAALERIIDAVTHTSPMPGAQQAEFPGRVHKLKPVHEHAEVLDQLDAVVLEGIERLIDIDLPPQMLVGPWRQFKE
jgi:hypothetical protein